MSIAPPAYRCSQTRRCSEGGGSSSDRSGLALKNAEVQDAGAAAGGPSAILAVVAGRSARVAADRAAAGPLGAASHSAAVVVLALAPCLLLWAVVDDRRSSLETCVDFQLEERPSLAAWPQIPAQSDSSASGLVGPLGPDLPAS